MQNEQNMQNMQNLQNMQNMQIMQNMKNMQIMYKHAKYAECAKPVIAVNAWVRSAFGTVSRCDHGQKSNEKVVSVIKMRRLRKNT